MTPLWPVPAGLHSDDFDSIPPPGRVRALSHQSRAYDIWTSTERARFLAGTRSTCPGPVRTVRPQPSVGCSSETKTQRLTEGPWGPSRNCCPLQTAAL